MYGIFLGMSPVLLSIVMAQKMPEGPSPVHFPEAHLLAQPAQFILFPFIQRCHLFHDPGDMTGKEGPDQSSKKDLIRYKGPLGFPP